MVRRLHGKSLLGIVFMFTTCLVLSCISSAFAQCPPDTIPCTGFPGWCCSSEIYCEDPTPPDCQLIAGTTTTSAAATTTVNPDCTSDEWDCGDGTCCPLWASCCKGDCCDRENEVCDNGQCRAKCSLYQIYGEDSAEVELLRTFRDKVLSLTPEGQAIIELYYQWSPVIVRAMEEDEEFREQAKGMVDGVLELITEEAE